MKTADIKIDFHNIWQEIEEFQFASNVEAPNMCLHAQEFSEWVKTLLDDKADPSIADVLQAKLLLLDRYFEWRRYVSKRHRNRVSARGHICIFHVFEKTYDQLKKLELLLAPKTQFFPDGPTLGGLFLGEIKEE